MPDHDSTLAMAGLFQAVELVQQAASSGNTEDGPSEVIVRSVFRTDPVDAADVFGGIAGVRSGLYHLAQLDNTRLDLRQVQALRHASTVLQLSRRLQRRMAIRDALRKGVARASEQSSLFGLTHHNVLSSLADLYVATIGQLGPRVIVAGEALHLRNPRVVARIRSLLLGAVRCGVLWHQCGGGRWALTFGRNALAAKARELQSA
jgi:high frequency lysogenization protein